MSQKTSQSRQPVLACPVYRLIDISPDLAVCPCPGMIVKKVDEDSCLLFTPGQSALEGFLVDQPWDRVVGDLNDELERAIEEAGEYEDEGDGPKEDEDGKG